MSRGKRKSEYERFMAHVQKEETERTPGLGPCWLWQGAITSSGHGCFKFWDAKKGRWRTRSAHKYSYIHHNNGMKQPWLHICHKCDVRACVNPEHLYEGTRERNMQDMMERGRGKRQFEKKEQMAVLQVHHTKQLTVSEAIELDGWVEVVVDDDLPPF